MNAVTRPDQAPRYPITARLERGRVRHMARWATVGEGIVVTLCGKRGRYVDDGADAAGRCAACAAKPNPQDCRSYV